MQLHSHPACPAASPTNELQAEMEARCAALFNGAVSAHWSITSHKSINCHLCRSTITPYAAYHPDCLRKHFVRRHEVRGRCLKSPCTPAVSCGTLAEVAMYASRLRRH